MTLWSNPDPSNATAAALGANARVEAPNIGNVVSAILENRYRKQQQYQQTLAQVGKAVGDYSGQQDAGQLADYISGHAPYVNADDTAQLASLPPEVRLKALQYMQQQNDTSDKSGMMQELNDAKVNSYNALANNRWQGIGGGGSDSSSPDPILAQRRQQIIDETNRQAGLDSAKSNLSFATGVPAKDLAQVMDALSGYKEGATAFPKLGAHPEITDASQGDYKQRVLDAANSYRGLVNGPAQSAHEQSLPQDTGEASPPPSAIQYLRAHPELAPDFDAKYGPGAAQKYF